ncbi:DUF4957 domain-containing protein [Arcticibacter tournemirensis]
MKKILIFLCLIAGVGVSGCSDPMDEITTLDFNRLLSPTDLSATVVNRTGVLLSWKAVNNAHSYTIEIFDNADFTGTAVKRFEGITSGQVPYTVTALDGQTKYFARVKALSEGVDESKWMTVDFTTDAEQILEEVVLEKLTFTSVTLNWPAGQTATSITITPGDIQHTVTTAEIAAGEATVGGLIRGTTYTATLQNGTKIRGARTFTTLGGAVIVSPGADLASLIANADADAIFDLKVGEYTVNADVIVSKSITIKAASSSQRPVIKGAVLRIKGNAGVSLKDLILDGTGSLNGNQAIIYDEALNNAYAPLNVENCEIKNYVKGVMYVNVKALIESVTLKENVIHHIECNGGDFIDFRTGLAKTFLFENNTVYSSAAERDLFRMDANGSTNFPAETSVVTIRTNTFNSVSTGASRRFLYIRLASHQIHFTKNLIANTNGYYSNQPSTTITTMSNNNYFNAPNFTQSTVSNAKNDTGTFTTLDPQFANVAQGDFTLGNLTLKAAGVGDLRWR